MNIMYRIEFKYKLINEETMEVYEKLVTILDKEKPFPDFKLYRKYVSIIKIETKKLIEETGQQHSFLGLIINKIDHLEIK